MAESGESKQNMLKALSKSPNEITRLQNAGFTRVPTCHATADKGTHSYTVLKSADSKISATRCLTDKIR
jgi:copper homeostasis protein CutC